jgi:hypothetical protein
MRYQDSGMEIDGFVPFRHMPRPREEEPAPQAAEQAPPAQEDPATDREHFPYTTDISPFGLYRAYSRQPTHDPAITEGILTKCDAPTLDAPRAQVDNASVFGPPAAPTVDPTTGAPFSNLTSAYLMEWLNTQSSSKSGAELERLCREVMQRPGFDPADVSVFSFGVETKKVDKYLDMFSETDGWTSSDVDIRVPCEGVEHSLGEENAPVFTIKGVRWRKITDIINRKHRSVLLARLLTTFL